MIEKAKMPNRLLEIETLYCAGLTQQAIADKVGISQRSVSTALRRLIDSMREKAGSKIEEARAEELAKINNLERRYWAEYSSTRDLKCLQGVERCISARREMLGLDAEKRIAIMDERTAAKIPYDTLTDEQLIRLRNGESPEKVIPGFTVN